MRTNVRTVSVTAPARLHLGFLDLNGSRGRRFGSIGLTLEGPCVELSVQHSSRFTVTGSQAERTAQFAHAVCARYGFSDNVHVTIGQSIPEHVGLGSGT